MQPVFSQNYSFSKYWPGEDILLESNQSKYIRSYFDIESSKIPKYKIPITDLINFNYQLKKPINVSVEFIDDEYFGYIDELEIYAYADTEHKMLREINHDLSDLFNLLVDNPKYELGKKPKNWKKILSEYIEKNNEL